MAATGLLLGSQTQKSLQNISKFLRIASIPRCYERQMVYTSQISSFSSSTVSKSLVCNTCQGAASSRPLGLVGGQAQGTGRSSVFAGRSSVLGGWGQQITRSKSKNKGRKAQDSDDEDSDDDEDKDDEDFGPHYEEDQDFPDNYKEVKKHMSSLRADTILGGGLNLSRKKVDDYFLGSKLLLNGERVLKKSKQMHPGDCIDLVTEVSDDGVKVKRVRLVKVSSNKSSKDRQLAFLRTWRAAVTIPQDEKKWPSR